MTTPEQEFEKMCGECPDNLNNEKGKSDAFRCTYCKHAFLAGYQASVPEGWVLVPREPEPREEDRQEKVNGRMVRFHNRRVFICELGGTNEIGVIYKNLIGWRKIRTTKFKLSQEAAIATFDMLGLILEARGFFGLLAHAGAGGDEG